jgi:transposase
MKENSRKQSYPSDLSDEEWAFVAAYLAMVREDSPQCTHDLPEVFNALQRIVRAGAPWRMMPGDLPAWKAVYQQSQRWLKPGCSRRWSMTFAPSCAPPRAKRSIPASSSWIPARSSPLQRAERAGYDGHK